jgi:hypothetical protein
VHFYSKFWRYLCSNRGSATRVRASRHRDVTHRVARRPGRRAFLRLHADRGHAPFPDSRAPRRIESCAPHASLLPRRTCAVRAADPRSVRGPGRTRAGRGAPYYGDIFAVTTTSRASRPYLRLPAFPPRPRHRRSRSPPRPPWPAASEPPLRVSPTRSNRPKLLPRIYRDLRYRPLPGIATPSSEPQPAAAATAGHRHAPSPEPPPRRPTPPIASR